MKLTQWFDLQRGFTRCLPNFKAEIINLGYYETLMENEDENNLIKSIKEN